MKGASMALLHDIQAALLDDAVGVGSILLKLRFLAAKLDADILEEWVQHEVEGYPDDVPVPEYRIAHVTYKGTFVGLGQQLNNTSISGQVVEQYAGKGWVNFEIRTGLPVIDQTLNNRSERGQFGIDASDLKVRLQGKIYEGMAIVEITGRIDDGEILRVQQTVRSKTLDFVLKLEKSVPAAAEITVGQPSASITPAAQRDVKSLTQQIFIGEVTNIQTGSGSSVALNVACPSSGFLAPKAA